MYVDGYGDELASTVLMVMVSNYRMMMVMVSKVCGDGYIINITIVVC